MEFFNEERKDKYGVYVEASGWEKDLTKVFGWMFLGLLISAIAAFTVAGSFFRYLSFGMMVVLGIAEIAIVIFLSLRITKMSYTTAVTSFVAYSVINGITLSVIFAAYQWGSIATAFLMSAAFFGFMALYGMLTKKDLSSLGTMLFIGLISILVASIVNIFLRSSGLNFIISYIGVAIFLGLTAYDMQKIKAMYVKNTGAISKNIAILAALTLYLDFINLFLKVLNIIGKRRD